MPNGVDTSQGASSALPFQPPSRPSATGGSRALGGNGAQFPNANVGTGAPGRQVLPPAAAQVEIGGIGLCTLTTLLLISGVLSYGSHCLRTLLAAEHDEQAQPISWPFGSLEGRLFVAALILVLGQHLHGANQEVRL